MHSYYIHSGRLSLILLTAVVAFHGLSARAAAVDVTCADASTDAATLNTAITGSHIGDAIHIHGTCLINATILLDGDRSYLGDSRTGTVIEQASGANLAAMMASGSWGNNSAYTGDPITVAHMTLNGNKANNSGTSGLVVRSWLTTVDDLEVENVPVDGIQVTNLSSNGTSISNAQVNSRFSNLYILGSGADGFHVVDTSNYVTDSDLLDSWIADSGASAVQLDNAAGWKVRGNHIYGVQENAIYASRCYATAIDSNYIEEFGQAGGATYYGIGCTMQEGAGSVISNNKVFMMASETGTSSHIFIGVPQVNANSGTGSGRVNVVGNLIVGQATTNDIGLSYQVGSGSGLQVLSNDNNVQKVQTARVLGTNATLVTPE
jgi:hypothetical protein